MREKIQRYGLTRTIDPRHFFPTIESAVTAFRQQSGSDWSADTSQPGESAEPSQPATS